MSIKTVFWDIDDLLASDISNNNIFANIQRTLGVLSDSNITLVSISSVQQNQMPSNLRECKFDYSINTSGTIINNQTKNIKNITFPLIVAKAIYDTINANHLISLVFDGDKIYTNLHVLTKTLGNCVISPYFTILFSKCKDIKECSFSNVNKFTTLGINQYGNINIEPCRFDSIANVFPVIFNDQIIGLNITPLGCSNNAAMIEVLSFLGLSENSSLLLSCKSCIDFVVGTFRHFNPDSTNFPLERLTINSDGSEVLVYLSKYIIFDKYHPSTQSALYFAQKDMLNVWTYQYLLHNANALNIATELSIRNCCFWGPIKLSLKFFNRCCGSEPNMRYYEEHDKFESRVEILKEKYQMGVDMPPLILFYDAIGGLDLYDGAHRYEAIKRGKNDMANVIIVSPTPTDIIDFKTRYTYQLIS